MEFSSQSWELPRFVTSSFKRMGGGRCVKPHKQENQDLNLQWKIFTLNDHIYWKLFKTDPAVNRSPEGGVELGCAPHTP